MILISYGVGERNLNCKKDKRKLRTRQMPKLLRMLKSNKLQEAKRKKELKKRSCRTSTVIGQKTSATRSFSTSYKLVAPSPLRLASIFCFSSASSISAYNTYNIKGSSTKVATTETTQTETGNNNNNEKTEFVFKQPAPLPSLEPCYPAQTKEFSLLPTFGSSKTLPAIPENPQQQDESVARALVIISDQMKLFQTTLQNQVDKVNLLTARVDSITEKLDGSGKSEIPRGSSQGQLVKVKNIFGSSNMNRDETMQTTTPHSQPTPSEDEKLVLVKQVKEVLDSFTPYDSQNVEPYQKLCFLLKGGQCHKIVSDPSMMQKLTSGIIRNRILGKVMRELGR